MPDTRKPLCVAVVAASLVGLFSAEAAAQDAAIEFRVVATARNPSACKQFDAPLSRVHTLTPTGDGASLRSPGPGPNSKHPTPPAALYRPTSPPTPHPPPAAATPPPP